MHRAGYDAGHLKAKVDCPWIKIFAMMPDVGFQDELRCIVFSIS